ncbi:beta-N-acetylhexosaminidase [Sphingosinicella rhizophila]|uniref:beta-N-acetylhexosaminidase n=1 Tax=Sphingosinicella rhizophila TaxID=3050082 RepID=A0ABU3Q4R5_9SPHN|nr:beta-N-acetylhexosaminidase [Sphingosinicella sp. GR2756]MDT9598054.1 beta-N-acetylhexosaminidase [Sphingosinicella sp. GR2756]
MQPAIYAVAGECLTADERSFFKDAVPAGHILFARNCRDKEQLRALTDDLRGLHGRADLPILVDQEGGRVARLCPPIWPSFPAAERFAALYRVAPVSAIEAARLNAQAIAFQLRDCGINVNSLPLLDVRQPTTHVIIGDRTLGSDPMQVAALGRAMLEGLNRGGIAGVVKHMPGHGRATSDSHVERPVVEASEEELRIDLEPFTTLHRAPMGMVAHILYTIWDDERPASQSPTVIREVIRGRIGFDGLLMSDDIAMQALAGSVAERAEAVLAAGCDVLLHCSAVLADMIAIASVAGEMNGRSSERLAKAMEIVAGAADATPFDVLAAERDVLLGLA